MALAGADPSISPPSTSCVSTRNTMECASTWKRRRSAPRVSDWPNPSVPSDDQAAGTNGAIWSGTARIQSEEALCLQRPLHGDPGGEDLCARPVGLIGGGVAVHSGEDAVDVDVGGLRGLGDRFVGEGEVVEDVGVFTVAGFAVHAA